MQLGHPEIWAGGLARSKENKEVEEKKGERSFTLLTFLEGRLSADHFDLSPVYLSKWLFVLSQCLEQLQGKGLFTLLHHIEIIYFYNCGQLEKELGNKIGAKIKRTGEKIKDFRTGHQPVLCLRSHNSLLLNTKDYRVTSVAGK